jgi:hypothetical protein
MSKAKVAQTGEGYLGETMVHRVTRSAGVVESVTVAQAGWPPEIILRLPDGTARKGKLSEFREPSGNERKKVADSTGSPQADSTGSTGSPQAGSPQAGPAETKGTP